MVPTGGPCRPDWDREEEAAAGAAAAAAAVVVVVVGGIQRLFNARRRHPRTPGLNAATHRLGVGACLRGNTSRLVPSWRLEARRILCVCVVTSHLVHLRPPLTNATPCVAH